MLDFLDELEKPGEITDSLYLPAGLTPTQVERSIEESFDRHDLPHQIDLASNSKTGVVLFAAQTQLTLVLPPFPISKGLAYHGPATEPLRSLLQGDHYIGLALVRLGAYAVGVCQGERLVASKVGTGLVHGRHRQGGSSQARFRRHREKQIEYFLTRVCSHLREHLEPRARALNYMVYGGSWTAILALQEHCTFLQRLNTPVLPPLLDIPDPRLDILEKAISRVWTSRVFQWPLDEPLI